MSLYLCVLEDNDEEVSGFQVGQASDFRAFLAAIERHIPGAQVRYRTLMKRADCDGEWSPGDCRSVKQELDEVADVFKNLPPEQSATGATSLYDCFQEVGAETYSRR